MGIYYLCTISPDLGCTHKWVSNCVDCEWREKVSAFLFFLCFVRSCQNHRFSLLKENLKLYCYVTMGMAACSVDL